MHFDLIGQISDIKGQNPNNSWKNDFFVVCNRLWCNWKWKLSCYQELSGIHETMQWIHEALSLQITLKVNNPKTESHRLMQIKHICISYKAEFSKMESPLHHSWLMKNHSDFDNSARSAFHSCDQRFMTRLGKSSIWVGSCIAEIDFLGTMVNWSCLILKGDGNFDSV